MPYLCDTCSDSAMPFAITGGHTFQSKALFTTSFKKEGAYFQNYGYDYVLSVSQKFITVINSDTLNCYLFVVSSVDKNGLSKSM